VSDKATGYVVYYCECLRDGREEGAECFDTVEQASAFINADSWGAGYRNITFRLFELGRELPLVRVTEQVPQPPVVKTQFRVSS
jgi:hypothetical protein